MNTSIPAEAAARRAPVGLLMLAWVLALAGALWAWLTFLSSIVRMSAIEPGFVLRTLPLPLLALLAAGAVVLRVKRGRAPRSSLFWVAPALLLAAYVLYAIVASYLELR